MVGGGDVGVGRADEEVVEGYGGGAAFPAAGCDFEAVAVVGHGDLDVEEAFFLDSVDEVEVGVAAPVVELGAVAVSIEGFNFEGGSGVEVLEDVGHPETYLDFAFEGDGVVEEGVPGLNVGIFECLNV